MYEKGDIIVYGNTGVCRIEDITSGDFDGGQRDRTYYVIKPVYGDCKIYAPVDSKIFMRPVLSRQEAENLIDHIPCLHPEAYFARSVQQLGEHYDSVIKKHSCEDLIELLMSLYLKRQHAAEHKQKFGQLDERFMKKAEELLYSEFSVALNMPRENIQSYIKERVSKLEEESPSAEG